MKRETISLIIFICLVIIMSLHFIYLHQYEELKISIFFLLLVLMLKIHRICCIYREENLKYELYFEVLLIFIITGILVKYAAVKKYISI